MSKSNNKIDASILEAERNSRVTRTRLDIITTLCANSGMVIKYIGNDDRLYPDLTETARNIISQSDLLVAQLIKERLL